ncbi:hypothetical protein SDJN03_16785, partial [Cucurbita argyrosperma subsp. sororia]
MSSKNKRPETSKHQKPKPKISIAHPPLLPSFHPKPSTAVHTNNPQSSPFPSIYSLFSLSYSRVLIRFVL